MTELYGQPSDANDAGFGFDKESLGKIIVRHPWAVRFLALEAILLGIVGIIPLIWTSDLFHAIFGMMLSLAILAAISAVLIACLQAIRRFRSARGH